MLYAVRLKGCKRCGGDLFLEHDMAGPYLSCLQCGGIHYSETFNNKKWRFPPQVKKLAVALKRGRSFSQVQEIIEKQYGRAPTEQALRSWCNGKKKKRGCYAVANGVK